MILLGLVLFVAIIFKIYTSNYYKRDTKTIDQITSEYIDTVHSYEDDDCMVFLPVTDSPKAVIVFYPGGKVDYKAYAGFMTKLSARGYLCVLPRMPENLAFLRTNAIDMLNERYAEYYSETKKLDWYIAGHSLGGVAATSYLNDEIKSDNNLYDGIILCASYPTEDFSGTDLRMLSIYGSEDSVLKQDSYNEAKSNWPADSTEYVIDGGIHSYFGCYGIQKGDGTPTLTNEEQLDIAVDVIDEWICEKNE